MREREAGQMGSGTQRSNLIRCPAYLWSDSIKRCASIVKYGRARNFALAVSLMLCLCLSAFARDGASELNELMSARESGLLTDWRIVGPFGLHPVIDFDRQWAPERDHISKPATVRARLSFFSLPMGR